MKKNFWAILALILSLGVIMAACGGETPEVVEEAVEQVEEVAEEVEEVVEEVEEAMAEKIVIERWVSTTDFQSCMIENIIEPFNAASDTITVETVAMENPWETTRTAMAGGEGPDVVTTPGPSFVFELVQAGQLLNLEEFKNVYGWDETFAQFALNLGNVDGELYSLADEMETLVVYYNKTLFEENGWEVPQTMTELHALAATIDEAGVIPFAHANAEWRPANEWFVGEYLNHVAGPDTVHQALNGEIPWTDPAFVEAISLLNEAQQNGWWMGGLEFYYTTTFDDLHASVATGESAMSIEGTWAINGYNDTHFAPDVTDNEWGWFPVPTMNPGESVFSLGMGNTTSISANTEHPQEAAEFVNYLFSPEIQAQAFVECGKQPAPVVIPEGTITGVDQRIADAFESLTASVASGDYGYTTWTFWPPKSDVYIYEEIEKVWAGDMTPEEYLEGLDAIFQEELAAGEIPPIPAR